MANVCPASHRKEMYSLPRSVRYHLGESPVAANVQDNVFYYIPDRWVQAEDLASHFIHRSEHMAFRDMHNSAAKWGIAPLPDPFARVFLARTMVDGKLRFIVGRGLHTVLKPFDSPSKLPEPPSPHSALPPNTRIQFFSDATRDLTPGTANHFAIILATLAVGGDSLFHVAFEWPSSPNIHGIQNLHRTLVAATKTSNTLECGSKSLTSAIPNQVHLLSKKCRKAIGSECIQLVVKGNATFVEYVARVVAGAERTEGLFPGWPVLVGTPSHPPQAIFLLNMEPLPSHSRRTQPLALHSVCPDQERHAFAKEWYRRPNDILQENCEIIYQRRQEPLHTRSVWVVAEYEDPSATYRLSSSVPGGLTPLSSTHATKLKGKQQWLEDATFIIRRCKFIGNSDVITCKFYLWYWVLKAFTATERSLGSSWKTTQSKRVAARLMALPLSETQSLRVLPPCSESNAPDHCEVPQAPYSAGPLVGLYHTDQSVVEKSAVLDLPPFSAPQLVSWAFRPLDSAAPLFSGNYSLSHLSGGRAPAKQEANWFRSHHETPSIAEAFLRKWYRFGH